MTSNLLEGGILIPNEVACIKEQIREFQNETHQKHEYVVGNYVADETFYSRLA